MGQEDERSSSQGDETGQLLSPATEHPSSRLASSTGAGSDGQRKASEAASEKEEDAALAAKTDSVVMLRLLEDESAVTV